MLPCHNLDSAQFNIRPHPESILNFGVRCGLKPYLNSWKSLGLVAPALKGLPRSELGIYPDCCVASRRDCDFNLAQFDIRPCPEGILNFGNFVRVLHKCADFLLCPICVDFGAIGHVLGGFAFCAEISAHLHFNFINLDISFCGFAVNIIAVTGCQCEKTTPAITYPPCFPQRRPANRPAIAESNKAPTSEWV